MAVSVTFTDEQANWLVEHIEKLESDWHWNPRQRPDELDAKEHASTIKRKLAAEMGSGSWDAPGGR